MLINKPWFLLGFCLFIGTSSAVVTKVSSNILLNGTIYYTVDGSDVSIYDTLDILKSTDLILWNLTQSVFVPTTNPCWANSSTLQDPDINIIGVDGIRIYFAARDVATNHLAVGVAFSNLLEPGASYSTLNRPLIQDPEKDFASPSMLIVTTKTYLVYVDISDHTVYSANLTPDGLAVIAPPTALMKPEWEDDVKHAWIFSSNDLHYMFYTSSSGYVGVARGASPLGPYIQRREPIGQINPTDLFDLRSRQTLRLDKLGWPLLDEYTY